MTREEAKDILEWGRPLDGDSDGVLDEFKEALGVAIEALEEESVIDTVLEIIDDAIYVEETAIKAKWNQVQIVKQIKDRVLKLKGGEQE